ncbi:unnamed protein product [Aspergillus oryzae]|nr:unnamed protein product [Aspergillus oryzae]
MIRGSCPRKALDYSKRCNVAPKMLTRNKPSPPEFRDQKAPNWGSQAAASNIDYISISPKQCHLVGRHQIYQLSGLGMCIRYERTGNDNGHQSNHTTATNAS